MLIIEITGVGEVEVDDSFLKRSPEQQQAIVDEIAATVRGGHQPRGASTTDDLETALRIAFPNAKITGRGRSALRNQQVGGATNSYHLDGQALDIAPMPGVSLDQLKRAFATQSIQLNEALDEGDHYHIAWDGSGREETPTSSDPEPQDAKAPSLSSKSHPPKPLPAEESRSRATFLQSLLMGAGDSASFGTLDGLYARLGAIVPGLANANIWDGKHGYSDAVDLNLQDAHGMQGYASQAHPVATGLGMVAGGLTPLGTVAAPARLVKALKGGSGLARGIAEGAIAGGAYSGLYGAGSSRGDAAESIVDGLKDVPTGAVLGGALGGVIPAVKLAKAAKAKQFIASEVAENPWAAYDAEVVSDLDRIVKQATQRAKGQKAIKALQDRAINSRVNTLERSYLPYDSVAALDVPPSVKASFKRAMDQRHTLSVDDISALRSTAEGNAVADAIIKAQRLRAIVPEAAGGARVGDKSAVRIVGEAAATAGGAAVLGPKGAAGARIGLSLLDSVGTKDGISQAAKLARAKAKLAPRYAQIAEEVGQSPAQASSAQLSQIASKAQDAKYLARQATAKAKAEQALTDAAEREANRKVSITNDLDNVTPGGGFRGYVAERTGLDPVNQDIGALRMVAEGKMSPRQLEAFLSAPERLQPGNAGNAIVDRLRSMADNGDLARDPNWTPPEPTPTALPVPTDAKGAAIRNPIAYAAAAKGNQDRLTLDHAASLIGKAPKIDLPVIPEAEPPSPAAVEHLIANFRAKYGRDPDTTNLGDFNVLFGISEAPQPTKTR